MNGKELRKMRINYHMTLVLIGEHHVEYKVDRPNVCAILTTNQGHEYFGFAKVNWPDEWQEEEGKRVALMKALAKLVKDINGNEEHVTNAVAEGVLA